MNSAQDFWKSILKYAVLAPSADNLQPWKFCISEDATICSILIDKKRAQHYCDINYIAPYISVGAVIENITSALRYTGAQFEIRFFPHENNQEHVCDIRLLNGDHSQLAPDSIPMLENRHTNRKFYSKRMISDSTLDKLYSHIPLEKDIFFQCINQQHFKFQDLARLVGRGDRLRFEVKKLHEEFFNLIRYKEDLDSKKLDGLEMDTLEAGPGSSSVFKFIQNWTRISLLNIFGLSRLFGSYAKKQMLSSAVSGVLYTKEGPTREDYIRGGQSMQRIWHQINEEGLGMQPMEGLPIFFLHHRHSGSQYMNEKQKRSIKKWKDAFYQIFEIPRDSEIILFFRMGYSDPVTARSKRRPLESFMIERIDSLREENCV